MRSEISEKKCRITLFCIDVCVCRIHCTHIIAVRRLCKFLCLSIFNKIVFLQIYCSIILRNRRKWVTKEHTFKRTSFILIFSWVFFLFLLLWCHFVHSTNKNEMFTEIVNERERKREKISFRIYSPRLAHQSENDWMFFITSPSAVCSTITV